MEELKKEFQNEMNQNEINEALKLFKLAIKDNKIQFTHADPIKQNCYTSSSDIYGVFFPNSEIMFTDDPKREFLALAKDNNNNLVIVYTYKDSFINSLDNEKMRVWAAAWHSEKLFNFVYNFNEANYIEKMRHIIKEYQNEIEVLKNIKLIYNKDGSEKADILKAFDPQPAPDVRITVAREYGSIRVGYSKLLTSKNGAKFNNYLHAYLWDIKNYNDIKTSIAQILEHREKEIKQLQREIDQVKQISKTFNIFNKAMQKYSATARNCIKETFIKYLGI